MAQRTRVFGVRLTQREKEVLNCLQEGLKTKQIASKFSISEHTVYNHRKNMLRKKGARNCKQLILQTLPQQPQMSACIL